MGRLLRSGLGRVFARIVLWAIVLASAFGALAVLWVVFPDQVNSVGGAVVMTLFGVVFVAIALAIFFLTPSWTLWVCWIPIPFKLIAAVVAAFLVYTCVTEGIVPQWTENAFPTIASDPVFDVAGVIAIAVVTAVAVALNVVLNRAIRRACGEGSCDMEQSAVCL